MRLRKPLRALLAIFALATGIGALSAAPAAAAPATPTATTLCTFHMDELIAHDVLSNGGTDFVWLKIRDTFYPPGPNGLPFHQGDRRDADDFGLPDQGIGFTGSLPVSVVIDRWPGNRVLGPTDIPCSQTSNGSKLFSGNGVLYQLTYTVTA
jgi:hypothetical protein